MIPHAHIASLRRIHQPPVGRIDPVAEQDIGRQHLPELALRAGDLGRAAHRGRALPPVTSSERDKTS